MPNSLDRETRATKIIKTLSDHGYLVTLLWWDRGLVSRRTERHEAGNFHDEIRLKFSAPWGVKALFYLPVWWSFVFFKLMTTEWDIAHAIQIISASPAILAGKLKKKPVVYDMLDTYEDSIIMPKYIRDGLVLIDKVFMRFAGAVVLADEAQIDEFGGIPNPNVLPIYDSPSMVSKVNINPIEENTVFTLFFAGYLYSEKKLNLHKLFAAIQDIKGIKVIIAGYGDLIQEIEEISRKIPDKVEFIGEIGRAEVLERSAKADLLFVLRDPIVPVNKYICGSKVLEAMMCGTPILVNKGTSTANKVLEENCGLVVDASSVEEIREAIIKLRDNPKLCKELGINGRRAYDERYNWNIMEKRLLDCYNKLAFRGIK